MSDYAAELQAKAHAIVAQLCPDGDPVQNKDAARALALVAVVTFQHFAERERMEAVTDWCKFITDRVREGLAQKTVQ